MIIVPESIPEPSSRTWASVRQQPMGQSLGLLGGTTVWQRSGRIVVRVRVELETL